MDKTTETKLENARIEYESKQGEIIREDSLRECLRTIQEGYCEAHIHFHRLYGAVGSIHFEQTAYSSLRNKDEKAPDANLLRALLEQFPPVPQLRVKDGCTSFRPDIKAVHEQLRENSDLYECYGVIVGITVFQGPKTEFEWDSYLVVGGKPELWSFKVIVPFHQTKVGRLGVRANYYGGQGSGKVSSYDVCTFHSDNSGKVIRWASGGREYPNSFSVYWDRDSGKALDFPAMIQVEQDGTK